MPRTRPCEAEASTETIVSEEAHVTAASVGLSESLSAGKRAAILAPSLLAIPLAACGGAQGTGNATSSRIGISATGGQVAASTAINDSDAAHFLLQAQFTAEEDDIAAVQTQGYVTWLTNQYAASIDTTGVAWLDARGYNAITTAQYYYRNNFADNSAWFQMITAKDQVRKRLVLALSEHFVVPINSTNLWPSYIAMGYWDMLNSQVFGNFRQLLEQITLNLGVGLFLNLSNSTKADATTGTQPDENFARECMQLFTIGLTQLNTDGSQKTDLLGNLLPTYSNTDVRALASVMSGYRADLTGITTTAVSWESAAIKNNAYTWRPMVVVNGLHSKETVSFLGVTIANADAAQARTVALDALFNHPNVGPFFGQRMIQRLVTSNPSPAYVSRVASAFNDNGSGVRGDLQAVWTAILTDPEALAAQNAATGGKLREPIVRFVQWARMAEVISSTGEWGIQDLSAADKALGQSPLRSPSVFNFFRPGYVPPNTKILDNSMVAPEFQLVSETTAAGYLNFMLQTVVNGVADVKPQYTTLLTMASDPGTLVPWLNLHFAANQLSANSVTLIQQAVATIGSASTLSSDQKLQRVQAALYLVMSCPEYLIQK